MIKFMIGNSVCYGNLTCKPSLLTEFKEKDFFKMLERNLKKFGFEHLDKIAKKKSNLKQGITIGDLYFIIKK